MKKVCNVSRKVWPFGYMILLYINFRTDFNVLIPTISLPAFSPGSPGISTIPLKVCQRLNFGLKL